MDVPPFWPPFLTFRAFNLIFLGTISHLSLDLYGSNFRWPMAHPHQFSDLVPPGPLPGAKGVVAGSSLVQHDTVGERGPFQLVVKTFIDDSTIWNFSKIFQILPACSLIKTPSYGTNFITTYTLNSVWSHVKEDIMLSVYWTPLHHSLKPRSHMYCNLSATALRLKNSCNQCNHCAIKNCVFRLQINRRLVGDNYP